MDKKRMKNMDENGDVAIPTDKEMLATWMECNLDLYHEFKDFFETILFRPEEKELIELYEDSNDIIFCMGALYSLAKGISTLDEWYTDAITTKDDFSFAICCYLCFDNGLEQIKQGIEGITAFLQKTDYSEALKIFIKQKVEDERNEKPINPDRELNLLTIRRWHYDHPREYAEFLESIDKAYNGDMTFATKGFNYLMEMLSLGGVNDMMELISSFIPGTDGFMKSMTSSVNSSFHDKLSKIMESSLDNEVTRMKILNGNPHFNSTLYWLVFDNGFPKAVNLISQTLLGEDNIPLLKMLGNEAIQSMIHTSFEKASYTKSQWKDSKKGTIKKIVASTLLDAKGRRGRKSTFVLLEEMLPLEHTTILTGQIQKIFIEWKEADETDTILAYIFAALTKGNLLNSNYNYRTFHAAMREKFYDYHIKPGFDLAEAIYNAIIAENPDYNIIISDNQVKRGRKHTTDIKIRLQSAINPNIS